ncbi:hypothetical protein OSK10_27055, partial [Escherichia coli]|nr:hypothetical protein [Escherichia coli]
TTYRKVKGLLASITKGEIIIESSSWPDVAKGKREVQAFLDKDKQFEKSFKIKHITENLDTFISFLKEIERKTDVSIHRLFNVLREVSIYTSW